VKSMSRLAPLTLWGMVIVVPPGDVEDATRKPEFYDSTFEYLREIGFRTLR